MCCQLYKYLTHANRYNFFNLISIYMHHNSILIFSHNVMLKLKERCFGNTLLFFQYKNPKLIIVNR